MCNGKNLSWNVHVEIDLERNVFNYGSFCSFDKINFVLALI